MSRRYAVALLQRAHIHEGSQLPGSSVQDFRLDWTHAFGTIRIEVKAGVIYVDGDPVTTSTSAVVLASVATQQG